MKFPPSKGNGEKKPRQRKSLLEKHVSKLYASMVRRLSEKRDKNGRRIRIGIPIEYTEQQLLTWLSEHFPDPEHFSYIKCPYSNEILYYNTCAIDHKIPLSRGGRAILENLQVIAPEANQEKGKLTDDEYVLFIELIQKHFPKPAMNDIRGRLKKAVKLAASVNWARKKK